MKTLIQFAIIFLVIAGNNVQAHAGLTSSVPKNNEQLIQQPEKLVLEFSKSVRLLKLELFVKDEKSMALNFKANTESKKRFEVPLKEIEHGEYTVRWIALGGDAHKMSGSFSFSFKPKMNSVKMQHKEKQSDEHSDHQH